MPGNKAEEIIFIILLLLAISSIFFFPIFSKLFPKDADNIKAENSNYIKAVYSIESPTNETKIFDSSYIDLIKSIKIEGKSVEINNIQPFEKAGNFNIEIYFKNELTSLESLFFKVNTLIKVDLSNLISKNIKTTSDMFNGCKKLNDINLNTDNIYNISNMFTDCSSLTSIDLSIFNKDKLKDVYGLFSGCNSLSKINLNNFNTNNIINMSNLYVIL